MKHDVKVKYTRLECLSPATDKYGNFCCGDDIECPLVGSEFWDSYDHCTLAAYVKEWFEIKEARNVEFIDYGIDPYTNEHDYYLKIGRKVYTEPGVMLLYLCIDGEVLIEEK